ncbi:hypothetical protein HGG72_08455 [Ochrobactrum pecoris]|nr:hypothetical protein [Brucella pecoris]
MAVLEEHTTHFQLDDARRSRIYVGAQEDEPWLTELTSFDNARLKSLCCRDIQIDDGFDDLWPVDDVGDVGPEAAQLHALAKLGRQNGDYALPAVVPSEEASARLGVNAYSSH